MSSIPVLGYWNISSFAEPIRLLLTYMGQEFEDKRYNNGPAPEYSRDEWLQDKFSLGLELPNLPYYIDGDLKITQTNAILRYFGTQHNLLGKSDAERLRCDIALEQAIDDQLSLARLCYSPNYDTEKDEYLRDKTSYYGRLEAFLGDHQWIAGDNLTIADFRMYEAMAEHRLWPPASDLFSQFPKLSSYLNRFEELPRIKDYITTEKFKSTRPMGRSAAAKFELKSQ